MSFSLEAAVVTPVVFGIVLGIMTFAPAEAFVAIEMQREVQIASTYRINPSHLYHAKVPTIDVKFVVLESSAQLMQDAMTLIEDSVTLIEQFGGK